MEVVQLQKHISRRAEKIRYIVIHDTGNTSAGAGADAHKRYFMTTDRKASADYLVEENKIIKLNDYYKYFTWHCGDGKGKYGITNSNSIGVEMCINQGSNLQNTINNTIKLVYKLMKELNIPFYRVVRHYDASHKICPSSMHANNWDKWHRFLDSLSAYIDEQEAQDVILVEYNDSKKFLSTINLDGYNYIKVRDIANLLGKKISFKDGKIIIQD